MCSLVLFLFTYISSALLDQVAAEFPLAPRASPLIVPAPIVVAASQIFQGNDGPWSTFTLQVGTPAQDVDVIVSTAAGQTWVVIPEGCSSSDPTNCASLRGQEFFINKSSTWKPNTDSPSGVFALSLEVNLNYPGTGEYGYDTVALGFQGAGGPSLDQQIVAGVAYEDFYLGIFGLSPRPTNFTDYNDPVPSYIWNLKNQSKIPSLSWSYTAGNQYRFNKVLGTLVLGGYDTSRYIPNDLSFSFNDQDVRDLTVNIEDITFTASGKNTSLSTNTIAAYVDSTIPYIYLPVDVCQKFESAFGITYDKETEMYLVNDTLHAALQSQNASVTFTLGNQTAGKSVDITLPYAAFDLTAASPLVENNTNYFPLKRATNDTQYTLGRTFLQEAYLTADYERRNFSVSQCAWVADAQAHIVAIHSPPTVNPSSGHTNVGAIAGGVVGGIIGLLAVILLLYFLVLLPRRKRAKADAENEEPEDSDPHTGNELDAKDTNLPGAEVDGVDTTKTELDAREQHRSGHELDAKHTQSPGHEMDGRQYFGQELDGGRTQPVFEMPANESPANEMPSPFMRPPSTTVSSPSPVTATDLPSPGAEMPRIRVSSPSPVISNNIPSAELRSPKLPSP